MSTESLPLDLPEKLRGKKIVLVNSSDILGGAAIVTFRLMQALRRAGLDARMVVYTKLSDEKNVSAISTRWRRGAAFMFERIGLFLANGLSRETLFKISSGRFALGVAAHPWVKEADIVCLGWFNQGLLGLKGIERLHKQGKRLVWTLHDMWAMTGICHHAYTCTHYFKACGNCQFLNGGGQPNDLSHRIWEDKHALYERVPIQFVTVSTWLEELARSSSLLRSMPVRTIHNAFPIDSYATEPSHPMTPILSGEKTDIIVFGAARIDDPIKDVDTAIDALNYIFDTNPRAAEKMLVIFYGDLRDPRVLDRLRVSHRSLGLINDQQVVRDILASAKVVLSTSLYETLGGTLVEGQAAGAIPVCFAEDGRRDVVTHKVNGYVAARGDVRDFARGILWALKCGISRESLNASVRERFSSDIIARKYISLFEEII
ncbi:MAG: glycosyltransferase [Duncaniella sp.]|nr:glycosyltransferase [Duncaniella sp.]